MAVDPKAQPVEPSTSDSLYLLLKDGAGDVVSAVIYADDLVDPMATPFESPPPTPSGIGDEMSPQPVPIPQLKR